MPKLRMSNRQKIPFYSKRAKLGGVQSSSQYTRRAGSICQHRLPWIFSTPQPLGGFFSGRSLALSTFTLGNSNFVMICNNVDMYTLGAVPMNGRAWGSSLPGQLVPRSFNHSPPPPSSRWGWQGNWSGLMGPIEGCQQGSGGDGSLHTTLDQSINLRVHLQCVGLCLFACLVYACVKFHGDAFCVFVYNVMCLACSGGKVYCIILIISQSSAPPLPLFLTAFNHCAEPSRSGWLHTSFI